MRYKRRYLHDILQIRSKLFRAMLITGPRRSGKSTLAKQLLNDWGGGSYLTFDTPNEQALLTADPEGFLRSIKTPAVLDEVQNVPVIFSYLKKIIDERPNAGCEYILTGSQQFQMMHKASESLAGRLLIKELLPFSIAEAREADIAIPQNNFKKLIGGNTDFTSPKSMLSKADVIEFLCTGGFPQAIELANREELDEWYNSYVSTYIQRDVRALSNIQNLGVFTRFVSLVAGRTSTIINYSELGKDIDVNYKTSQHYLSLLIASYLWKSLPAFFKAGSEKRLSKRAKGAFLDTGLARYLIGISKTGLERSPHYGALFETLVFLELLKLATILPQRIEFMHFRSGENKEVDLVIEIGNSLIPIEIKASGTLNSSWGAGIREFRKVARLPEDHLGYVISLAHEPRMLSPHIQNIPFQFFL